MSEKKLYIECACTSKDHVVCMTIADWTHEKYPTLDLYLNMQMIRPYGFFRRLWVALCYLFKETPCNYGKWNETLVSESDAALISEIALDYIDRINKLREVDVE